MVAAKRSAPKEDVVMQTKTASDPTIDNMDTILSNSAKKTRIMFSNAYSQAAMDEQAR
jgi:pleiotropic regulator 1